MSLRFICIEVRKQLRCANVFLQFDQSLTETEFLKINVDEDALRLCEYSTETRAGVAEHFSIDARTMSNLTVEECNASFRLSIGNIKEDGKDVALDENKQLQASPQIQEAVAATLSCRNCKQNLLGTEAMEFQRIREFPSGSIDMGEFFCHHGPDFGQVLVPQTSDLFYGFQFIILNRELLKGTTREKESNVYCSRCLQYLGETLFTGGKAVKLWADTLLLSNDPASSPAFIEIFPPTNVTPTSQLLHKVLVDSAAIATDSPLLPLQMHFSKVLLETTFANRQRKFLLLHILEKQLQVLRNTTPLAHGSHNNNNVLQVQLSRGKCFKLLYRLLDSREEDKTEGVGGESNVVATTPPLLAFWQQDISIQTLKVSPTLFSALLEELECNSLLLPELYRYSHDNFQLSYVFY